MIILLHAFVWSEGFTDYQNLVILIVCFMAVFVGVGLVWARWGCAIAA